MKKIYVSLLLIAIGGLGFNRMEDNTNNMKNIDTFLRNKVDKLNSPSVQYAFFDLDSTIYEFSYGDRDIKERKQVDSATTYNLFSVTKTFTALAVLQLVQEGTINLHSPVSKYLEDFPYTDEITVEQLLNHSSGIPNPLPLKWIHLQSEHDSFDKKDFFTPLFQKHKNLKYKPGYKFNYSNLGYVLLGQLIEKVSGKSYENYVMENIIRKVGANSEMLTFQIKSDQHAKGYQRSWSFTNMILGLLLDKDKYMDKAEGKWKPFKNFYINGTPYGGLIGSRQGLIKYGQALMKTYGGQNEVKQFSLSQKVRKMHNCSGFQPILIHSRKKTKRTSCFDLLRFFYDFRSFCLIIAISASRSTILL